MKTIKIHKLNGTIETLTPFQDFQKQKTLYERNIEKGYFDDRPNLKDKIFFQLLKKITGIVEYEATLITVERV